MRKRSVFIALISQLLTMKTPFHIFFGKVFYENILMCTVSEKIIIHDCPDNVKVVGNHLNVSVFWTPPTAELLTINGTIQLEPDSNDENGGLFSVGTTQVEYRYESQEATAFCNFTVSVGNYLNL